MQITEGFHIFTLMKVAVSISDLKVDLAKLLMATEDKALLADIYAIMVNAAGDHNWYERLDADDKEEIRLGEEDFEAGRFSDQDEMMERIKACNRK